MKTLILALLASAQFLAQPVVTDGLLTAAANDFKAHQNPAPVDVRNVHLGMTAPRGGYQYLLCGEFRSSSDSGEPDWTPFATIKTGDYEQWLGDQATIICSRQYITWEKDHDLSADLKIKLNLK